MGINHIWVVDLRDPDPGPGHAVHVVQMQVDLVSNLA